MRNVRLYCAEQVLDAELASKLARSQFAHVDYVSGTLFFLKDNNLYIVEANGVQHATIPLDLISEISQDSPVVLFDFLSDSSELCIVCRSGHVFTCDLTAKALVERGCIVDKVWGGAWNPDYQLLVVATKDLLISISRDFETVDEVDLFPTHAGKEELQTVGWGSKQTQFQGQAGKANREKVDLDRVPTELHKWDQAEYNTLVSWRADAQLLATSTVEEIGHPSLLNENGHYAVLGRRIRIWDRNLQLLSCCDVLAGIEPTLTLRPGKNLILTSRLFKDDKHKAERSLWFFEQNGQYLRNKPLPMGEDAVLKRLQWNADGSILMLLVQYPLLNKDQVQFFTVSNAEWTLKGALDFTDRVVDFFFSQEIFLLAHCLTVSGKLWRFEIDRVYDCIDGIAVSVCADTLRFSDFNKAPIPPPMCHSAISLPANSTYEFVSSLALNCNNQLAVLSSSLNLHIYSFESLTAKLAKTIDCQQLSDGIVYGINWASKLDNCVTVCHCDTTKWTVYAVEDCGLRQIYESSSPLVYQVLSESKLFAVEIVGVCIVFNVDSQQVERTFDTKIRSFFSWKLLKTKGDKLIGLSPKHSLLYNNKLVLENCTSFSVTSTEDYVIASTFANKLWVLSLDTIDKSSNDHDDYRIGEGRLIERGANVVGHEPGQTGTKCILQMPRGNLEQIHPRDLLVERTKTLIDQQEYRNALKEMRRHRLNMNLLFDHNPEMFIRNISAFVAQFDATQQLDIDLLQLFIEALTDEDCTRTLFVKSYSNKSLVSKNDSAVTFSNKVQKVADLLLERIKHNESSMKSSAFEHIYPVILSCYVKPKSCRVVEALQDLKQRIDQYNSEDQSGKNRFVSECLRHLCYNVKESVLFDSALRTYDMNIVSMIADKQQKDPREYLPIIEDLRSKTPDEYRNYYICLHLQDWKLALKHISTLPDHFEECLALVKQKDLYVDALALFNNSSSYKEVCQAYAEFLSSKTQYRLAALFFQKCANWDRALKCLELGRLHHDYIHFYACLDNEQKKRLGKSYLDGLKKMAVLLEQTEQHRAAAEVLTALNVETNLEKICGLYVKSNDWRVASELMQRHQQTNYLSASMRQRVGWLSKLLDEWSQTLKTHCNRLLVLREVKAQQIENWTEGKGDTDFGQSEMMSEVSTVVSNISKLSSVSTASSRRRKNVLKKKAVVKEGSHYEDAAILLSLKRLYLAVDSLQDEFVQLLPALLSVDLIDEARQVHNKFDKLFTECQKSLKFVWPEFLKSRDLPGPIFETYRCEDGIIRMPESGTMPPRIRMEDEMHPPTLRTNVAWKLDYFV